MLKCFCVILLVTQVFSQRSFYKFAGPLSGPVQEIQVDGLHGPAVDYIAKPDYAYSYGIEDPKTGNTHSRHESRNGDAVSGEYTVLEADGSVRVVQYTADPHNGFQATVHYKRI
ncbi:hypothetical protein RN001_008153 [Aquatica leii]|uniref:Uncharacterized protein n=1 Tax=Aquatica leii TaxID=1421715 RepID=A0AAN7SGG2_9COLE|nr:hypothetical protein RN001_008153 [Aquatica leii]